MGGGHSDIRDMKSFPGEAWKASREVAERDSCYHNKPTNMKMWMENGELASNDKQNVKVFEKNLSKVYNNQRDRFTNAAKFVRQREKSSELDSHITLKEFERAISMLQNNKASGVTGVPAEAFKCLDDENGKQVYFLIVDF